MPIDGRAQAWVRLHCAGFSAQALAALLRHFGSPEAAVAARAAQRKACLPAGSAKPLDSAEVEARVAAALCWLEDPSHRLVAWDDADYPQVLLQLSDPPPVLYALGDPGLLRRPALAIVGSRNGTPQGCLDAQAFAEALSKAGLAIVSGLAWGIDAAAHRGALREGGSTIAVIGTGADRVYPARNRSLAREIAEKGLIVSEFVPGTPPIKANFPRRNRIISGLARGVLVVEATLSSGSLITARLAGEQGREVFAVPGSIHSPFARGCHRLIRDGAKLVETAQDILEELGMIDVSAHTAAAPHSRTATSRQGDAKLRKEEAATATELHGSDPDARVVWSALNPDMLDVDTLVARTSLSAARVLAALGMLEVDARVASVPGGRWQRIA